MRAQEGVPTLQGLPSYRSWLDLHAKQIKGTCRRCLDPGIWDSESTYWNHHKKIMGNSSGKVQARNKQEIKELLEPHFPSQVPQSIACTEDRNGVGKGTGPRSLDEHLEELRLFSL